MSAAKFVPGIRHQAQLQVTEAMTVPALAPMLGAFSDMPPVFATAVMVGFIEATCIEALVPYLKKGQQSVGVAIEVSHEAATPVGMTVTAEVELIAVDERKLRFRVECRDDRERIAAGFHDRFVIDAQRFLLGVRAKAGKS